METREQGRRRKLAALLRVLLAVTPLALLAHLFRGDLAAAVPTALALALIAGSTWALQRGASTTVVATVTISLGAVSATFMGVASGAAGTGSLAWLTCLPIVASAVSGPRAGTAALLMALGGIVAGIVGIEQRWLVPFMALEGAPVAGAVALTGVTLTVYALVRSYELQTQRYIEELKSQNQALVDAQAATEQANRAKSDFLATMSHELRTPLHGVTGLVRLLRDEQDPARRAEELRLIDQSAVMLQAVINDVLDFSKIEAGGLDLETVPLSVSDELEALRQLLEPNAEKKGVRLAVEVAPEVPRWVLGDATRLRQVLLNLLSNALKFTAHGEVRGAVAREGEQLVFSVTDTGLGMPPEVVTRLFRPFVQADSSTTRRFGGTGLGLVISQRLVGAMGGSITVTSEEGKGSRFTVRLPCRPTDPPAVDVTRPVTPVPLRRRVLVVEDNAVNQLVASRLLERMGHEVRVVSNGAEALVTLASGRFDVVLMDVHMPVMDGFDATRALRQRGDLTPIFALTAGVTNDDRQRCLDAGMTDVLSKPLRFERLSEVFEGLEPPAALT